MRTFKMWSITVGTVLVIGIVGTGLWSVRAYWPVVGLFLLGCVVIGVIAGLVALVLVLRGMWLNQQVIHRGDVVVLRGRGDTLTHLSAIHVASGIRHDTWHGVQTLQPPTMIEGAAPLLPTAPSFATIQHEVAPNRLCLGYGVNGAIYGALDALLSTAIVGRPNTGKTTMLRFACAQLLKVGGTPIIIDPHGSIVDELGTMLQCAETSKEITRMSIWLERELDTRLDMRRAGKGTGKPLLLLADEWPIVAAMCDAANDTVRRIVLEGRKVGMFALISGQGLPASLLGGTLVRDALSSRYVFNTTPQQARMAGIENETAKELLSQLEVAGSGKAILATARYKPELIAVPQTTVNDIRALLIPERSSTHRNPVPPLDRPFPTFPDKETSPRKVVDSVSSQERERIIELARAGVPRREMCGRLGRGKGYYYGAVKSVLDQWESENA